MRNLLKTVLLLTVLVPSVTWAATTVIICEKGSGSGYTRFWSDDPTTTCQSSGGTCRVTVQREGIVPNDVWFETAPAGGVILHARFASIEGEQAGTGKTRSLVMDGFVFGTDEVRLTLAICAAYPQYEGVTVRLDGVVVGTDGWFAVYLPPVR